MNCHSWTSLNLTNPKKCYVAEVLWKKVYDSSAIGTKVEELRILINRNSEVYQEVLVAVIIIIAQHGNMTA